MAKAYIREYQKMAQVQASKSDLSAPQEPGVDQDPITVSGTHAESAAFATDTRFIGITCDGIMSLVFGAAPVATTNHFRIPAGVIAYYGVIPGQKVSLITNT